LSRPGSGDDGNRNRPTRFPDPQIEARADGAGTLLLRAQRPAKGVWLAAPGVQFDDNAIDLMPQRDLRVQYQGSLVGLSVLCLNTVQDAPAQPADTRR
jgi:beta-mannosidase